MLSAAHPLLLHIFCHVILPLQGLCSYDTPCQPDVDARMITGAGLLSVAAGGKKIVKVMSQPRTSLLCL